MSRPAKEASEGRRFAARSADMTLIAVLRGLFVLSAPVGAYLIADVGVLEAGSAADVYSATSARALALAGRFLAPIAAALWVFMAGVWITTHLVGQPHPRDPLRFLQRPFLGFGASVALYAAALLTTAGA